MNEFNKLTLDQKLWLSEQLASGEGITESGELTDPDGPRGWDRFYLEDENGTIYEGMYYWDSEGYAELTVTPQDAPGTIILSREDDSIPLEEKEGF